MALDPNEVVSRGTWEPGTADGKPIPAGVTAPDGVDPKSGDIYAQYTVYRDGHRDIQWYRRGTGDGKTDPVLTTTTDSLPAIKQQFEEDTRKDAATTRADAGAAARGDQEGDVRPSSGPTREAYHGGKWVVEPNPTYQQPAAQNPNTPENQNAAELQRQREKNAALPANLDPAYETDKERRDRSDARIKQQGADEKAAQERARQDRLDQQAAADKNKPQTTFHNDASGHLIAVIVDPTDPTHPRQVDTGVVGTPNQVTVNGVVYERGANGYAPVKGLPSEGAATTDTIPFPQFIAGQTEDALRAYHEALWKDPTKTDAQRIARFGEATAVANQVVQQAATDQRERESQRNAEYNTASSKLTYLQTGTQQALDFVSKLNGTLPKGSDLGGKALAAILGLQMLQMHYSGIDSISKPGTSASRAQTPTITNRDLNSNAALTAKNEEIAQHTAAAATGQNAGAGTGDPPSRANLPAQPTTTTASAPRTAPATTGASTAGPSLGAGQDASNPTGMGVQSTASTDGPSLGQGQDASTPPESTIPPASPVPSDMPPGYVPPTTPNADPTITDPSYTQPQYTPPVYETRPADMPPGEVTQMPTDWAALTALGDPTPPAQPVTGTPSQGQDDMASFAARKAQIAATPPWRLSDDDLAFAQANGLMNEAMQTRRSAA